MIITSKDNAWIRRFMRALAEHDAEIVLEGPKQVADAIAGGWEPIAVATSGESMESQLPPGTRILPIAPKLFGRVAGTRQTQGVAALFRRPEGTAASITADRDRPVVVLDRVQDPGNVGTIVRLAAAFDAAGVILLDGSADPFSPKAIRASAGSILSVPVAFSSAEAIVDLATKHRRTLLAAGSGGPVLDSIPRHSILIFGSEGQGVSPLLRSASQGVAISISDKVESLNVATAAAILLSKSYQGR